MGALRAGEVTQVVPVAANFRDERWNYKRSLTLTRKGVGALPLR